MVTKDDFLAIGFAADFENGFDKMALSNTNLSNTLSFLDDEKFVDLINSNPGITGCIVTPELAEKLVNKFVIVADDPRFTFYTLFNHIGNSRYKRIPSEIHPSAQIHPRAYVSEHNVVIGENTRIAANVTILEGVSIGNNCFIQAGAVIGSEGFEYKKTRSGILPVFHDGKVIIYDKVEIGANCCIDKGFSFRNTILKDEVKIDNLTHIAHGVHIHKGAFIIAGTVLGGSTTVGEYAWVGINASVAPGVTILAKGFVSMGAVVTRDVAEDQQVTGNFAIEHQKFLSAFKNFIKQ